MKKHAKKTIATEHLGVVVNNSMPNLGWELVYFDRSVTWLAYVTA
jgi:hypothetical protein